MGVPKSIRTDGKRESLGGFALTIPSSLPCELPARYLKKVSKCQQKAYLRILVLFFIIIILAILIQKGRSAWEKSGRLQFVRVKKCIFWLIEAHKIIICKQLYKKKWSPRLKHRIKIFSFSLFELSTLAVEKCISSLVLDVEASLWLSFCLIPSLS